MTDPKVTPAETPLLPPGVQWRVAEEKPPPLLAGDRVLIAVPVIFLRRSRSLYFDVIRATETGWDTHSGFEFADASHYCLLDPERTERDMPDE